MRGHRALATSWLVFLALSSAATLALPVAARRVVSRGFASHDAALINTTFVGLFLTTLFTGGLQIEGLTTWILAPLIVWVAVLLAAILLPMVLFKKLLAPPPDAPAGQRVI